MQINFIFSKLLLVTGALLLVVAGYFFVTEATSSGKSKLEISFIDPTSLAKLNSMSTNRLMMAVHNPTATPARIVGNSAC